jgi:hypothetical protein
MPLEVIEGHVRIEHRILIVEAGDEADRHLAFGHRIDEAAAEFLEAQRIAHRMNHGAGGHPLGRYLPQLLDADGEQLRMIRVREHETPHELFGEIPRTPSAKIVTLA